MLLEKIIPRVIDDMPFYLIGIAVILIIWFIILEISTSNRKHKK